MDIFETHRRILNDYANYIRSFIFISVDLMHKRVGQHLDDGNLWFKQLPRADATVAIGIGFVIFSGTEDEPIRRASFLSWTF